MESIGPREIYQNPVLGVIEMEVKSKIKQDRYMEMLIQRMGTISGSFKTKAPRHITKK